jgi:glycoside/pentoside/hexuronide:cation symporter, GPH family
MGDKLPIRTKLIYGVGDFGFSLTDTTLAVIVAIFLTDVVGLSPALAAGAVFIGRSFDYINDPIIGYLTDRTRTRWGRRRPYLLFGWLPFALTFAALLYIPPFDNQYALAAYYAVAYMLFDLCATLVYMPYFSLTPELSQDYDERTSLTTYRMIFSILAGLVAFTVPLAVIGTMRPENSGRILLIGVCFGLAAGLPLLLTALGVRERKEYQNLAQPKFKESIRSALQNKPFIFAVGIFLFTWSGLEIVVTMLLYFLKYRMNLEAQSNIITGTVFITALLTLPFWTWASRRFDKRIAYIAGMVFLSLVMITMIVIDPSWGFPVVITLAALAGVGIGAVHVLPWSMIPDAVEWGQRRSGQRNEGMLYSLVTLLRKMASSIAIPLVLLFLGWNGYQANAAVQPASAVRAIQFLMGPLPTAFMLTGILFAALYPLGRAEHRQLVAELKAE